MSVIAVCGDLIAADRQASVGDTKYAVRKIFQHEDYAYSYAGMQDQCAQFAEWYKRGASEYDFPESCRIQNDICPRLIVLTPKGFKVYEGSPFPTPFQMEYFAIGCGREAALGALYAGADAVKAVQAAITHVTGCGFGVDVVKIPQIQ